MFKKSIFFLFFCLISAFVYADIQDVYIGDGGAGKKILVHRAVLENPKENKEDKYYEKNITEAVIADIMNFSNIKAISADDVSLIKELQKESESGAYDEASLDIELGKMQKANQVLRLTITRRSEDDYYNASFAITNVTTGVREGSGYIDYLKESDLLTYGHGMLTVEILRALDVKITKAGERYIIGKNAVSDSSNIDDANEDKRLIEDMLKKANDELNKIDIAKLTSAEAESIKLQLEQKRLLLEQRKQQAEERIKRLEADAKRKQEDAEKRKKLNEQQQKKIEETTKTIELKAEEIRKKKIAMLTAYEKISVIENEKKTLLDMNNEILDTIESYDEQSDIDYRIKLKQLKEEFAPGGKHDIYYNENQEMSTQGQNHLVKKMKDLENENIQQKKDNDYRVKSENSENLRILRNKISSDISNLQKETYMASSISDNNIYFRVNNYNHDEMGWSYTISFGFDGQQVFYSEGIIYYKDIAGKKPPVSISDTSTEKELIAWESFMDEVQEIDSYFRMNIDYVIADIHYRVVAENFNQPSAYSIIVPKISFKLFDKEKSFASIKTNYSYMYQYNPITMIDWRSDKIVKQDDEKYAAQLRLQAKIAEEQRKEELQKQKDEVHRLEKLKQAEEKQAREDEKQRTADLAEKERIRKETDRRIKKDAQKKKYAEKLENNWGKFGSVAGTVGFGEKNAAIGANFGFNANIAVLGIGLNAAALRSLNDGITCGHIAGEGALCLGSLHGLIGIGFEMGYFDTDKFIYYYGGQIAHKHFLGGYKYITDFSKEDTYHQIYVGVRF